MPTVRPSPVPVLPRIAADYDPPPGPLPRDQWPDMSLLITSDDTPVDNMYAEKQQRLLIESLHASWVRADGQPFQGYANVGLFHTVNEPPVVPDAMFAFGPNLPKKIHQDANQSFFVWVIGRPPDVALEIVSDRRGGEDTTKLELYHRIGVPYYVIYDRKQKLCKEPLRVFAHKKSRYQRIDPTWLPKFDLGLTFWNGVYETETGRWLRWIDGAGELIATGSERIAIEKARADAERDRVREEKLRVKEEKTRAEAERTRADIEKTRAEAEKTRADNEQLRAASEQARAEAAEALIRELEAKLQAAGG